ncbi:cytochrome P450 [Aspergillus coremiiformis]|uniref:Cytochrome P450 n=1 Tax=Aspergillus coremiiformis TaxID=138285 RepID=A0A5N6ZB27_9EURO|nr:cytochrome P450 [Aspergillus coremiiformis]
MFLLFAAIILFILGKACYRLYFHPLRSFPGPKLAAITTLYEAYFAVIKDGQFIWEIGRLHDKYGPIVRITPDELHIRDASFYNEIYSGGSRVTEKPKSYVRIFGVPESMVATVDHNHHHLRRKILNKYFSKRSISDVQPLIQEKIETLMQHFRKAHGDQNIINLYVGFSALTGDIISNYAYGTDYCFLRDISRSNEIKEAAEAFGSFGHILKLLPFDMPRLRCIPSKVMEKISPAAARVVRLHEKIGQQSKLVMSSKQTMSPPHTVFEALIDPSLPAEERTLDRLQDEGFVLLGAGTETTSWALTVTMFYLLSNQELFYQLHEELKTVMPQPTDTPNLSTLEALSLLRAVVHEGLRLSFGVLTRLPRVAPLDALNYKGHIIPPGTPVSETTYFIHMDRHYFPDPHTFNPRRWLGTAEERRNLESMIVSFSKGSRQCLGINLAYAELFLTLATLVRRFELKLIDTTLDDVEPYRDHFLIVPKNGQTGVKVLVTQEYA